MHTCCHNCAQEENRKININLLFRILIAIILVLIAHLTEISDEIKLILYIISYTISGFDIIFKAIKNILRKEIFDENFLMSIATIGAILIGEYAEAVTVMVLYQIGEFLQDGALDKSENSIIKLMDIRAEFANIEINGTLTKKNPSEIKIGDIIIVKAGEKVPLDGEITDGYAEIDTSALTGESLPKKFKKGDEVLSGYINLNGLIRVTVTKEYKESTASKIIELAKKASLQKAKTERFITKFARYYTPFVVISAVIIAILPPLFGFNDFETCIKKALTFLVISCPCALVISIPLVFFSGIGAASKSGILFKGSNYIEVLSKARTIIFDKTGTLTNGKFKVTNIIPNTNYTADTVLETASLAETYSNHPIATAIKEACPHNKTTHNITNFSERVGYGISAEINGNRILIGNNKLMKQFNIDNIENSTTNNPNYSTKVYIAKNSEYLGAIIIEDELKETAKETISKLQKDNKKIIILTGDRKSTATKIANELNIKEYYSDLLPQDKVSKIEESIQEEHNGSTIFIGDGINDTPALSLADAGIAMGGIGTTAAIEAADIVIMDDNLLKINQAIKIATKTIYIAKENIIIAISIKVLFLILGATGNITMWNAVFADTGVTLLAILNALRLLK